ncbi:MAG: VTT domain-containing protein [Bacillota bacterium]|nr:VTT domain-containing protein [Bacillota bacterium]
MGFLTGLLNHYGYIVLFIAIGIELAAFPTPGEALMTYCGYVVFLGKMNWILSILAAAAGASVGISFAYFIGSTLGTAFFQKFGAKIHIGPDKIKKVSDKYGQYGNKLIIAAYFVPGVRHVLGYTSGIIKIPFKKFAINAYIGALIWASAFVSLGKVLGTNWERSHKVIIKFTVIGCIVVVAVLFAVYVYKRHKEKIIEFIGKMFIKSLRIFRSFGNKRIAMVLITAAFLSFFILLIGVIEDFLGKELSHFDRTMTFLVKLIFPESWEFAMNLFRLLSSVYVLVPVTFLILIWIIFRSEDKLLELRYAAITILGGVALSMLLRIIFHRMGPMGHQLSDFIKYTFPGAQTLMAVVIYGFASFILIRYTWRTWVRVVISSSALLICILTGISLLYFHRQFPSDITSGYIFGGAWLSLNIILLEVTRSLPELKKSLLDTELK